jgi:hypothetical protein
MKTRPLLLLAALLALGHAAAHAEYWTVTEGQRGEWRGNWPIKASTGEFKIGLRFGDAQVVADGYYIRSGNIVSIARTRTSDGNDCHYMGTVNGNTIVGTMYCASGGPYRWSAVIHESDVPGQRPAGQGHQGPQGPQQPMR